MKMWIVLLCGLLLVGCGTGPQWETVSDTLDRPVVAAEPASVTYTVPDGAVLAASTADALQNYYVGPEDRYEVLQQCFTAESLNEAVKAVTGFDADRIAVVETRQGDCQRYDMSWTSAGETTQVCRGTILHDGSYYYCLTFACAEDFSREYLSAGEDMLQSFALAED